MIMWSRKILRIGSKINFLMKQKKWDVGKLNSFGKLIAQSSHVPCVFNYIGAFWFFPRKNKSCVRSRSYDMVTYLVCVFEGFYSLTFWLPAGQLSVSWSRKASDISPRTNWDLSLQWENIQPAKIHSLL